MPEKEVKVDDSNGNSSVPMNSAPQPNVPKVNNSNQNNNYNNGKKKGGGRGKGKKKNNYSTQFQNSNQQVNASDITNSVMNYKNYCGRTIAQLESSLSYASYGYTLTKSDIPVQLNFSITYDRDDLWNQANVGLNSFYRWVTLDMSTF
jgi:hypothetical protein